MPTLTARPFTIALAAGLAALLGLTFPVRAEVASTADSPVVALNLAQRHLAVMAPLAAALAAQPLSFDFLIEDPALGQHVHVHWQQGLFRQEREWQGLLSAYGYDGADYWYGSVESLPYRLDRTHPGDATEQWVSFLHYATALQANHVRDLTDAEAAEAKRLPQLTGFELLAYCPPAMSEQWLLVDPATHVLRGSLLGDDRVMDDSGVLQLTLFGDWQDFGGIEYPGTLREMKVLPGGEVIREAPVQTVTITPVGARPATWFGMVSAPPVPQPTLPGGKLVVPFGLTDDDITLKLHAPDGQPLILKFDSGANVGLLRPDVAQRLGLIPGGSQPVSGHGGSADLGLVKLSGLTLGGVELPAFSAAVIAAAGADAPGSLAGGMKQAGVHGLIGTILLNAFVVGIDFKAHTMTLYDATSFTSASLPPGTTELPLYRNGLPFTEVVVDNKLQGGAFFNTGAQPYFNLQVWALDRAKVEYPIEGIATGMSIHGLQLFGMIRPKQVELGSLLIKSPKTFLEMLGPGDPPESARMASFGSEFFHDHRVTFDLLHERVYVEPYG